MQQLTLGIEAEILAFPRPTGVERSLRLWLSGLATTPGLRVIAFTRTPGVDLPDGIESCPVPSRLPLALWREARLPRALNISGADVLLSPVTAFPLRSPIPTVATLHEVPWLEEGAPPPSRRETWRARLALKRADIVLAVSEAAAAQARTLANRCGLSSPRIEVACHGFDPLPSTTPLLPTEERPPLVLTLSAWRPRKNLPAHLEAFGRIAAEIPAAEYIIVGPTGAPRDRLAARARELGLAGRVTLPGYLSDEEVDAQLRRAVVLFHAPLSEGFGFTPLEALARGCVPLLSRRGALAEISGPAALYVEDPHCPRNMSRALLDALRRTEHRQRCLAHASETLSRRNPERAIARLVEICARAARRTPED